MIEFSERILDVEPDIRVFVYRNLHKNLYSVRGPAGRVIAHTDNLILKDVKYCVGQKGRERVLRTKHKNVHAGLRGTVTLDVPGTGLVLRDCDRVVYDPYKFDSFVLAETKEPIYRSDFAVMTYVDGRPVIYAI